MLTQEERSASYSTIPATFDPSSSLKVRSNYMTTFILTSKVAILTYIQCHV